MSLQVLFILLHIKVFNHIFTAHVQNVNLRAISKNFHNAIAFSTQISYNSRRF